MPLDINMSMGASDLDEVEKFEINPLWYCHLVITQIIKAPQFAFINGQEKAGLMALAIGVDQLEKIVIADKMMDKEEYKKRVEEIKKDIEADKDSILKEAKIANTKFQYLLEKIFLKKIRRVDMVV